MAILFVAITLLVSCAPEDAVVPEDEPEAISEKHGGVLRMAYYAPSNLDPAFLDSIPDDQLARLWSDFWFMSMKIVSQMKVEALLIAGM